MRVAIRETLRGGERDARRRRRRGRAEAELGPAADLSFATGGGYDGPLETRQGERMRPDVALAFDRMEAAARADGVALAINSGYRSDAEQAVLWARHPDPKWVARPARRCTATAPSSTSARRRPTPGWPRTPPRFHFIQRYAWEPWHFGFVAQPGARRPTRRATATRRGPGDGEAGVSHGAVPGFVPARFAPMLRTAAQRWNVSAKLLAAQLYAESGFNPFAVSGAGAQGIAQFMPATARGDGARRTRSTPSRRSTPRPT